MQTIKIKTMCEKGLNQRKMISLIILAGFSLTVFQTAMFGSDGDKNDGTDSEKSAQKSQDLNQESESNITAKSEYTNTSYFQEAAETEMEIENWMLNSDEYFDQEEEILIEEWMYNISSSFWQEVSSEYTEEYAIEDWMLNPSEWIQETKLLAGIAE